MSFLISGPKNSPRRFSASKQTVSMSLFTAHLALKSISSHRLLGPLLSCLWNYKEEVPVGKLRVLTVEQRSESASFQYHSVFPTANSSSPVLHLPSSCDWKSIHFPESSPVGTHLKMEPPITLSI